MCTADHPEANSVELTTPVSVTAVEARLLIFALVVRSRFTAGDAYRKSMSRYGTGALRAVTD